MSMIINLQRHPETGHVQSILDNWRDCHQYPSGEWTSDAARLSYVSSTCYIFSQL